jgi:hypothetical protein
VNLEELGRARVLESAQGVSKIKVRLAHGFGLTIPARLFPGQVGSIYDGCQPFRPADIWTQIDAVRESFTYKRDYLISKSNS